MVKRAFERDKTLREYIYEKIDMLENEFYLKLTEDEEMHMCSLKTESEVDRYAHQLLKDKL
jgi:hypothetical protein